MGKKKCNKYGKKKNWHGKQRKDIWTGVFSGTFFIFWGAPIALIEANTLAGLVYGDTCPNHQILFHDHYALRVSKYTPRRTNMATEGFHQPTRPVHPQGQFRKSKSQPCMFEHFRR